MQHVITMTPAPQSLTLQQAKIATVFGLLARYVHLQHQSKSVPFVHLHRLVTGAQLTVH
jgi:hypothetical protein